VSHHRLGDHGAGFRTAPVVAAVAVVFAAQVACSSRRAGAPADVRPILGFASAAAVAQREVEARFRALPAAESVRAWHRELTKAPHVATSPRTKAIAEYIAATWRAQGLDQVTLHRYDVLSSNPRRVAVEMVAPVRYTPSLREDPIPEDPDTAQPDISGAWTSFSASGDVTAPVVFANSGNPADYDELRRHGIDPTGKIVIVRYSNPYSYRGYKALTAQREGVAALIVYSDPAEDGFAKGAVYPTGPWGPASHVQRGGIAYDYIVPGDPLTPGWASVDGARRIAIAEAASVPTIMALPMSHQDIQPILEQLGGPEAPTAWKGALPITYRLGGSRARLHLTVDMQTDVQPNWVVEGRLTGSERPDEWVVLGNHHDAWVFGGVDPSSGTAAMLELTKALGTMKQQGVRPKRTLVFGAWDGEEVTLTGSTEWGEQFRDELRQKAVAYLNVDSAASGPNLALSAVGTLAPMIVELTKDLTAPSGESLYDHWRTADTAGGLTTGARQDGELVVTRIGSGSDHTVFLNHVGLPVVDMSFNGPYGVYHSAYDSHHWVSTIGDPGFVYTTLMTRLWGTMALRLANADVLPLDVAAYATAIGRFVEALVEVPDTPTRLDVEGLRAAVGALGAAGQRLNTAVAAASTGRPLAPAAAIAVNRALQPLEQVWLHHAGIPGRAWFKHLLYAPRYTYAAMTLPGVTEAAEAGDWPRARAQLDLVVAAAGRITTAIDAAAAALEQR
jgi:N-acetylated-alpha-linked acidic dipeptidase